MSIVATLANRVRRWFNGPDHAGRQLDADAFDRECIEREAGR